jgi:hypothetical protein
MYKQMSLPSVRRGNRPLPPFSCLRCVQDKIHGAFGLSKVLCAALYSFPSVLSSLSLSVLAQRVLLVWRYHCPWILAFGSSEAGSNGTFGSLRYCSSCVPLWILALVALVAIARSPVPHPLSFALVRSPLLAVPGALLRYLPIFCRSEYSPIPHPSRCSRLCSSLLLNNLESCPIYRFPCVNYNWYAFPYALFAHI